MQPIVTPVTIRDGLVALDIDPTRPLLVHCSLSAFGSVHGGAQAVVQALTDHGTTTGTIVMPTFTPGRFDPSEWANPPLDPSLWERVRFETPLFDPRKTPVDRDMSRVYDCFRCWPDAQRSRHPHSSFAARGPDAVQILAGHALDDRFGERSPVARLYALDAHVLFLGTGYDTNTCFHLAEYRIPSPPTRRFAQMMGDDRGGRVRFEYADIDTNSSVFAEIGDAFEQGEPGGAACRAFSLRDAADFARDWLIASRA